LSKLDLSPPKGEAAREKADAENQRSSYLELLRAGTWLRVRVEVQVGENQDAEEPDFGENEAENPDLVVIGKDDGGAILPDDRVGPVGISYVP
jgi:hypothetical protein